jgi:hypothetical protein
LFVEFAHVGQQFLAGHDTGFAVPGRLDHDHESHGCISFEFGVFNAYNAM